jgi:hypothetical protein
MKRGSLVGPLILILIGVVFLLKNFRPDLPLFDMFMTYWPFLLIAWGGLRLIEILVTYFRGMTLPTQGIAGGEWALIIVLTVIGSSVWGVQHVTRDWPGRFKVGGVEVFGESYDYPVEDASVKSAKNVRVVVENVRGNTKIVGADVEEVRVGGRKSIRAMERGDADKANQLAAVKIDSTGSTVTISGNQDKVEGSRVSTDLEITVPKGASVEARGRYGDFEIIDIAGDASVNSDNAGVRLQNIGGKVRVDTRRSDTIRGVDLKGDVELKGRGRDVELENVAGQVSINGSYSGETVMRKIAKPVHFESAVTEFHAEKVPGELQLTLSTLNGTNVTGPFRVKAKGKDVRLTEVTDAIDLDIDRGDVEILEPKLPTPKIDVKLRSGNIELALPPQAKFTINAYTERGEASNDFDSKLTQVSKDHGATIIGTMGPGPEIKLGTGRGELTLRKMSPAESAGAVSPAAPGDAKPPKPPAVPPPPRADNQ